MKKVQFALIALVVLASGANAQVAGRLSGSVVDQTGAAVAGASVNVYLAGGREPVLTAKTNQAGLFAFIAVRPDKYDVAVEAKGFTRVIMRAVKVDPVQETGLPPLKLEVQATTQTIEVGADVSTVQYTNAEVSTTITTTQLENIPLLSRQVSALFSSQAGVNATSETTAINGLRSSFSSVTLDGINIQDNFIRTNDLDYMPMRTTIDQVAEITITTTNASAAMGGGASHVVLSTRSGSNDFHGSFYWYNRNSALAANNWFNNQSGVAKSFLDLNQPGASLGGRILRDKLFFYVNYELYRNKKQTSTLTTVLTDTAKNGVLQYRDSADSNLLHSVNLQTLRNFTVDPTMKALIAQLPSPNNSNRGDGLNTAGYRFNARGNEFRDQFVYKGDYYITSKHGISGTYNYISNPTDRPDQGSFFTVVPPVSNTIKNHVLSLSWRWTASATLTNEARGGFARTNSSFLDSNTYPAFQIGTASLLFTNPVNSFLNQGRQTNTYHFQDNANWIHGKHRVSFGFQTLNLRTAPFNDASILPTYNLGISSANTTGLTASDLPGIRSTDITIANSLYTNLAGIISSATQTFNVNSRTSGFVSGATNLRQFKQDTYAVYVQDTWKVLPRLTLSLGLRYEYWTPLDEINGLYLAPRLENNNIIQTLMDPNATLDFIGGPAGPFYKADKNNFAPNIGLAWDPFGSGKTSIRAGYMMAYVNDNLVTSVRNNVTTSAGLSSTNNLTNQTKTLAAAPTIPIPVYKVPRTLADNYTLDQSSATGRPNPDLVTPYVQQWNFGIQHEFKNTIFEVRYVGNHGTKLIRAFDYNQVLYNANGFLADFQRAQGNADKAQAAGLGYIGAYNANVPGSQPLTVFPLLGGSGGNFTNTNVQTYLRQGQVGELANYYQSNLLNGPVNFYTNPKVLGANTIANSGSSTYNGLQFEARRRTRSGLQWQFSYSFSKGLSNAGGDAQTNFEPLLDNNNPSLERARSPLDITHAFKANVYYELPYGTGKRWSGNKVMNAVFGSWAIASNWGRQSGSPYSILSAIGTLNRSARSTATNTASVNGTNGATLQPVTNGVYMTGTGPYFVSPSLIGADGRAAATFGAAPFAGQLFFNPVAGTVGNLQRRMFTGPWDWSWDMAVKKSFVFRERHKLDFHFDMANFMNHPTFYIFPQGGDYASTTNYIINNTTFGKITTMNHGPRVIQIGAYYRF